MNRNLTLFTALLLWVPALHANEQRKDPELSLLSNRILLNELPYAQCWDPGGWFWKPAKEVQRRIAAPENKINTKP